MNGPPSPDAARAVPRPDDRDPAAAALLVERLRRLDHALHVRDVDVVRGVPAVRMQEVVLVVDDDVQRPVRTSRQGESSK